MERLGYAALVGLFSRKTCPHCKGQVVALRATHWEDATGSGMTDELSCVSCGAQLFRELGKGVMTPDEHAAWRAARSLPTAKLRK